jgi:hypothetical protein
VIFFIAFPTSLSKSWMLLFDDRTHNIYIDVASGWFFVVSPAPVLCGFWKTGVGNIVSLVIVFY